MPRPSAANPASKDLQVWLGHGASGDARSMAPFVQGLEARGLLAGAVDLPKRKAEEAWGKEK